MGEVIVIDRDNKEVRRWIRSGQRLTEAGPDEAGRHRLTTLDVTLRRDGTQLIIEFDGGTTRI